MIISHKYQTVFVHIPKCAGTSVRRALSKADPDCERFWGWRWLERHQRYADSAHLPLIDLHPAKFDHVKNYTTVTLSRDPLTRFLSGVNQHFQQHAYRRRLAPSQMLAEMTSTDIRYNAAYIHFCPQHYFINIGEKRHVDHILKLEDPDWNEKLREILVGQGFPAADLNIRHLRKNDTSDQSPLSPSDMRKLYMLYKRDYKLLGYTPPLEEDFVLQTEALKDKDRPCDFAAYDEINLMDMRRKKPSSGK